MMVCAVDSDTEDQLFLMEYWRSLDEYANGEHAESDASWMRLIGELVAEKTTLLEADPVWVQPGMEPHEQPAGVRTTLDLLG